MENSGEEAFGAIFAGSRIKLLLVHPGMRMVTWGMVVSGMSSAYLWEDRAPHSYGGIVFLVCVCLAVAMSFLHKEERNGSSELLWVAFCVSLACVFYWRAHEWAPVVIGALFSAYFWTHFKATRRFYPHISAVPLFVGMLSFRLAWPNEQRCLVPIICGGIAVALHGAWSMLCSMIGEQHQNSPSSIVPQDMQALEQPKLFFVGRIGNTQICLPEFERRMRTRYAAEARQLNDCGFDCAFYFGETISVFRLLWVFPALMILDLKRRKAVMTLYQGTKILVGNPVFVSKDKKAYAHPNSMSVTFHTAFKDGTLLLSRTKSDKFKSSRIVNYYGRDASICEMWNEHQVRIETLEAESKSVDCQSGFQFYEEMVRRENIWMLTGQ